VTDLYEELYLSRSSDTADIQRILAKQRNDWTARSVAMPDEAARVLALIDEAERAFATDGSRTAYDEELARSKAPDAQPDQDAARRESYERFYDAASEYFGNKEYDLAETAVSNALKNAPADGADHRLCVLASGTYFELGKYAQSLDYLNQAIVLEPGNAELYVRKYEIASRLGQQDAKDRRGMADQLVNTLRLAIKKAEASADRQTAAEAESHLAKLLFTRMRDSSEAEAVRIAQDALSVDADLEGARHVIDILDCERRAREEEERRRREEEQRRRREEEARARKEFEDGWRLLVRDSENNCALYIKKDIIEERPYQQPGDSTWEDCTLRKWLNNEYYNSLPAYFKSRIVEVINQNPSHLGWRSASGDNSTRDKVFLLSIDEAERYFGSNSDRVASYKGVNHWWWLRSSGNMGGAASVWSDGGVNHTGIALFWMLGVRPALWLNL
jgi:tetratricopeptide (TPR) repeat protein